jgi:hypothetical protein
MPLHDTNKPTLSRCSLIMGKLVPYFVSNCIIICSLHDIMSVSPNPTAQSRIILVARPFSSPGVNADWPPSDFAVLPSAIILRRRHVRGTLRRTAACLMLLHSRKAFRVLFISSAFNNCSVFRTYEYIPILK